MQQLLLWVCVSLVLAWLVRHRPFLGVALVMTLWFAVPSIATHYFTGVFAGNLALHPATWLALCLVAVNLFYHPGALAAAVARHPWVSLVALLFVVGCLTASLIQRSGGNRLLFDQVVGPLGLFWLLVAFAPGSHRGLLRVRDLLIALVAGQCVLTVLQNQFQSAFPYQTDFEQRPWFNPERWTRWFGTTDSPLALSLTICAAAALTVGLRSTGLRVVLLALFVVGSVITQSRTGVALTGALALWTVLRGRASVWGRALSLLAVVAAAVWLLRSSLVVGVLDRFGNDTGSTEARLRALSYVGEHWTEWLLVGNGLTSSYEYAQNAGLESSIESSYLMYAIDVGFVLATLFFGMQLALVLRYGLTGRGIPGAAAAAAVVCALQHTFSGTAASSLDGMVIWTVLGLLVAGQAGSVTNRPATYVQERADRSRAMSSAL